MISYPFKRLATQKILATEKRPAMQKRPIILHIIYKEVFVPWNHWRVSSLPTERDKHFGVWTYVLFTNDFPAVIWKKPAQTGHDDAESSAN